MRKILILVFLAVICSGCQPLFLEGTVVDNQWKPLPGATVKVLHSRLQTITDATGKFTLTHLHVNDTIQVSLSGYETASEVFDFTLTRYPTITIILDHPDATQREPTRLQKQ